MSAASGVVTFPTAFTKAYVVLGSTMYNYSNTVAAARYPYNLTVTGFTRDYIAGVKKASYLAIGLKS